MFSMDFLVQKYLQTYIQINAFNGREQLLSIINLSALK